MDNHLGPFSDASEGPEGQERDVGGPDQLQSIDFSLCYILSARGKIIRYLLIPNTV